MRKPNAVSLILAVGFVAIAGPAFAQATNPYNVSWSSLNPQGDWSATVLQSLFPIPGFTQGVSTGNEATVIGQLVGQFTGFVAAIACAFVSYNIIMNIHRAAESSQVLGSGQTWMAAVRIGFAAIMMFPLGGGFCAGQEMVMQGAMWGVGMAKSLYTNAIQAVGPDAIVIATPQIPGTSNIVANLINDQLCMDLVNLAGNGSGNGTPLIPVPQPLSVNDGQGSGFVTWSYSLATGDGTGNPVCGSVTVREAASNATTIAGVNVDMAATQQAILTNVINGDLQSQVQSVAQNLWLNKTAASLAPLQGIYNSAVADYTNLLTTAATGVQSQINTAIQSNATAARNGNLDLLNSEQQQSTLGWTAAGAYYLEIARLNAETLSVMNATPDVTTPTYDGLGSSLSDDLAPVKSAADSYMQALLETATTADGSNPPSGIPTTLASATDAAKGQTVLAQLFNSIGLNDWFLNKITAFLLPPTQVWTDPFGGLMSLGQVLMNVSLAAFAAAGILASGTGTAATTVWNVLTGNWAAAAATVAIHPLISFLSVPIFMLLTSILMPGMIISYVLPMVPYVMWMAGVCGWIILVCEAMIAVPLWMLAHMTIGGDGLHGRAIEGWGLLFNVMFRPTLMIIGLFLSYFVFDCMSWLIRESFGIAVGFVLANGWFVTNLIGIVVLLNIFVMLQVTTAIMSFRMIALLPHHLPRLLGFTAANRVDIEAFQQQAAWGAGQGLAGGTKQALSAGLQGVKTAADQKKNLPRGPAGLISGPQGGGGDEGLDSTLRATTDQSDQGADNVDV
ncbi:membrane protein [Acidocella aquatica]|uniref:Membrane protein n=1 Tax=Acidocella aquatica TaxID=1922313 RepID=A0ABQ6A5K1_9PROT|nr:DotA/TraY family protein [Acidocella aquatica]GLR66568.1 membrane protein [Acidocella aquatica]